MPKPEKLLEELRSLPTDISFDDVRKLLESFDWDVRERNNHHVVVVSPQGAPFTIVHKAKKVKRGYLRLLLREIEQSGGV